MRFLYGIVASVALAIAGALIASIADREVRVGAAVVAAVVVAWVLAALLPVPVKGDILDLPEGWRL